MADDFNANVDGPTLEVLADRIDEQQAQISGLLEEIARRAGGESRTTGRTEGLDLLKRDGSTASPDLGEAEGPFDTGPVSRRGALLALGGMAAGGVGVAIGSAVLGAQPAAAADGDGIVIGTQNSGEGPTYLTFDGLSALGDEDLLTVYDSVGPLNTSFHPSTIAGWASDGPAGVVNGVYGYSVMSSGFGTIGLAEGDATTHGVFASSSAGYGLVAGGALAPLQLLPAGAPGAPTSGAHALGEQYVDSTGVLYRCVTAGTPGTWVPNYSVVPLARPVRVISTPSGTGNTGGLTGPFNPTGATHTTSVLTGASTGIPANAVGVVANLALSANGAKLNGDGYLTLFPAGTTNPDTTSINAGGDAFATSNGVTVAFGTGVDAGKLSFSWQGGGSPQPCQVFLDVTAYIL